MCAITSQLGAHGERAVCRPHRGCLVISELLRRSRRMGSHGGKTGASCGSSCLLKLHYRTDIPDWRESLYAGRPEPTSWNRRCLILTFPAQESLKPARHYSQAPIENCCSALLISRLWRHLVSTLIRNFQDIDDLVPSSTQ
jgi:hypothetical protein